MFQVFLSAAKSYAQEALGKTAKQLEDSGDFSQEHRMARAPPDVWAMWNKMQTAFFEVDAAGLFLKDGNGQQYHAVKPHPVSKNMQASVGDVTRAFLCMPYAGMRWVLNSILDGSAFTEEHKKKMTGDNDQVRPLQSSV